MMTGVVSKRGQFNHIVRKVLHLLFNSWQLLYKEVFLFLLFCYYGFEI